MMRAKDGAARLGDRCYNWRLSAIADVWRIITGTIVTAGAAIRDIAVLVAAGGIGTAERVISIWRDAVPMEAATGDVPTTDKTASGTRKAAVDSSIAVETSATTAGFRGA